jgi:glycoside hydrolase-like protein
MAAGIGGFFVALVAGSAMFLAGGEGARSGMWVHATPQAFLGFDSNEYPGDAALAELRRTFAFSGYWLNPPPGAKQNTWAGKRETMLKNGFGFLVLFNGRTERQLEPPADPALLGEGDAKSAVENARREGFPANTAIFLDQEEGGRMTLAQMAYISKWIQRVNAANFRAGIYCSGMPAKEAKGESVVTAGDIRQHLGSTPVSFFVYNDACPPSPGCVYRANPPSPSASGVAYADVWQFAQSPRRRNFTRACRATYNADGNCYPPNSTGAGSILLDLDSATSADPSSAVPQRID